MADKVELEKVTRVAKKHSVHTIILSDDLRGGDKKGCWMLRPIRAEAREERVSVLRLAEGRRFLRNLLLLDLLMKVSDSSDLKAGEATSTRRGRDDLSEPEAGECIIFSDEAEEFKKSLLPRVSRLAAGEGHRPSPERETLFDLEPLIAL
jgi:hypothetical protein